MHTYICMYIYIYIHMYLYIYISLSLSHEKLLLKLTQTRSDIYFLSCCKKLHLVPHGFCLRNPFRHHPDNYVSQAIIDFASAKLSNIALHKSYAKQKRLWTLLDSSSLYINDIINVPSLKAEMFVFLNRLLHKKTFILLCHKNKKLHQLIQNSPLHSSLQDQEIIQDFLTNKKPSMHFRKQTKISTVFNLSNIKLSHTVQSTGKRYFFLSYPQIGPG